MRAAVLGTLAACGLLAACAEQIDVPPGPHAVEFEWRTVSPQELRAAYVANGRAIGNDDKLDGFVGIDSRGQWVVYTTLPQRLDDRATCTLGHEVLHIVAGAYHR